jgi:hypothetical protein
MMRPGVFGTVTANDGSTLTVTGKQFTRPAAGSPAGTAPTSTTVTYTVDTTSATTVTKNNAASTVSAIAVGDTVAVQGTVGTITNGAATVTATSIRDGVMPRGQGQGNGKAGGSASANANAEANLVAGNGQPVIGGAITAIGGTDGTTLTVTNKSNVTYSVETSGAKFLQGSTTIAFSNLKQGDNVIVQGTVNGTNVTASTVIDQGQPVAAGTTGTPTKHGFLGGIFGGIGSFFSHIFGF